MWWLPLIRCNSQPLISSRRANSLPDSDFDHPVVACQEYVLQGDRQAPFDCFANVREQFLDRIPLRRATGKGRHFSPEAALFRPVNHDVNFHNNQ